MKFPVAGAVLSSCGLYRYDLWRRGVGDDYVLFIGLNPSTADAQLDDATIRRCTRFAIDWGYSGIHMANLFAYRATKRGDMLAVSHPIGPANDKHLHRLARNASVIVAAWGADGSHRGRDVAVVDLLRHFKMQCLGTTKGGQPRHPLYMRADTTLRPYTPAPRPLNSGDLIPSMTRGSVR